MAGIKRIFNTLIELAAAAVFILPLWCVYNKLYFRSWKRTGVYLIFGFYLTAVLALVGFPSITLLNLDPRVNLIPFVYMLPDLGNACLNLLLFVPLGLFLPTLWKEFRSMKQSLIAGLATTAFIELSQLFTGRATDIDDMITNCVGTVIGYWIARWVTSRFTKRVLPDPPIRDFYLICGSVGLIMFVVQPFVSSLLWALIL